jgi:hypothetical protein
VIFFPHFPSFSAKNGRLFEKEGGNTCSARENGFFTLGQVSGCFLHLVIISSVTTGCAEILKKPKKLAYFA